MNNIEKKAREEMEQGFAELGLALDDDRLPDDEPCNDEWREL